MRIAALRQFVLIAALLGGVAWMSPPPSYPTDRGTYMAAEQHIIVPDCSDLHCFRVLVAWALAPLPGPSLVKWKTYAVLANAAAAVAVGNLCLILGFSTRAATLATWTTAFGFGSLYTLYDCYTSDPLMFFLGPLLTGLLLQGHRGRAGVIAGIGVFAKEFAAAPLLIFVLWAALQRRWELALRTVFVASTVMLIWVALQLVLSIGFNYTYAGARSADVFHGGFLMWWLASVGPRTAVAVLFAEFGALYLLAPVGWLKASKDLRLLALAALPAALALLYVQQPDRALWNFHFVMIPLAVLALDSLPAWASWLFVVSFAVSNLRFGAQLQFLPAARFPFALSVLLALAAGAVVLQRPRSGTQPRSDGGAALA